MSLITRANLVTDIYLLNPCEDNLDKYIETIDENMLLVDIFNMCRKIQFNSLSEDIFNYMDYLIELCCNKINDKSNCVFYKKAFRFIIFELNDFNININDKLYTINDILYDYDEFVNKDILRDVLYFKLNILLNMDSYDLEAIMDTNTKLKELLR